MIAPVTEIAFPKASDIDYFNTGEVEGYSVYLLKLYERDGGLTMQPKVTRKMRAIEAELRIWCDKVKNMLMDALLPDLTNILRQTKTSYIKNKYNVSFQR